MSLSCSWPQRRAECALLLSLIAPHSPTPHLHVHGPPHCGKTSVVLDVLRQRRCAFAFVDALTAHSHRSALRSIAAQLSHSANTPHGAEPNTARAALLIPPASANAAGGDSLAELAVRLRALPALLHRTAFIVLKSAHELAGADGSGSGSSGDSSDWLGGLLSLTSLTQRHVTVILIDRGSDEHTTAAAAAAGLLPVHFAAYSPPQLAAILTAALLPAPLTQHTQGSDAATSPSSSASSSPSASSASSSAAAALSRFVLDVVNSFSSATADLRELHRLLRLLLATHSNTTQQWEQLSLHAVRREVKELAASAVYRFDYTAVAVAAAADGASSIAAEGELLSWVRLLSPHLSRAQYYLLFASYIASHNSTQDDTRLFGSEAVKVSPHAVDHSTLQRSSLRVAHIDILLISLFDCFRRAAQVAS